MIDLQQYAAAPRCGQAPQALPHGGAAAPRRVIRGERPEDMETVDDTPFGLAHIDWFSFTVKPTEKDAAAWLRHWLEVVFLIPPESWRPRDRGWQGYERCADLGEWGIVAYGGATQRGTVHVSLNAAGTFHVRDWNAVRLWCETFDARIARIDLAHDDLAGERVTVDKAAEWLLAGHFKTGGREPECKVDGDWIRRIKGRTLYVGSRESGKLCRVYEKGKQLGDLKSPWCRVEVEYRGQSRAVPLDVLARPGCYLAGAYPCLKWLNARQDRIATRRLEFGITYERMVELVRTQYGQALNVMAQVEQGDAGAVLSKIVRPGRPRRLVGDPPCRGESGDEE
jgi:phage replication initiation protein